MTQRPRQRKPRPPLVLLAPAVGAALIAFIPLVYIVVRASEGRFSGIRRELVSTRTFELLIRSVVLAASVTAASAIIGCTCAYLVTRTNIRFRSMLGVVFAAPLALPTYVSAYTWLAATGISGFRGSFVVLTTCCYPYVYIPVRAAMSRIDGRQVEVSRSLGISSIATFTRVTLPQLRSSIASGSLLVTLYVLSDFGAVSLMRHDVFTNSIFLSYQGSFDRTPAAILSCALATITGIIVWAETKVRKDDSSSAKGAPSTIARIRLSGWTFPAWLFSGSVIGASLGLPLITLLQWSQRSSSGPETSSVLWATIRSTTWVALLGALFTIVLAIPVAVLVSRYRNSLAKGIEASSSIGHALPGLVIALSLVFFGVRFASPIYQRLPLLIGAYGVLFLPLAVSSVRNALVNAPVALDDVGRSLGVGPTGILTRVLLPIAAPGIGAGAVMVFLTCVKELPATLLLRPTGFETLATRLWTETSVADYGRAAPYALAIVAVASVPTLILTILTFEQRSERRFVQPRTGLPVRSFAK